MWKFGGSFAPLRRGRSVSSGDEEKALMCLCFQSGGSAVGESDVSVLPKLFVMSLGKSFVDVLA